MAFARAEESLSMRHRRTCTQTSIQARSCETALAFSARHCHVGSSAAGAYRREKLDAFPGKSLPGKKKTQKNLCSRCSLIPASVEKIDARICAGGGSQEAFHVRSTAESFLFTPATTTASPTPTRPPRGCDPGAESNARTDLRKLNAGRQQRFITRAALRMGRE